MRNFNEEARVIIKNYPYYHESRDPYVVLISTVLSQRTTDENKNLATNKIFKKYKDVFEISNLSPESLYELVRPAGMYRQKSERIIKLSKIIVKKYNGKVPKTIEELIDLPGVGRKTANVVLYVAFNLPALAVDTHVHRIANRLKWINTKKPKESEFELMKVLDRTLWGPINGSMVSFGKQTCKPINTKCLECPLKEVCPSSKY